MKIPPRLELLENASTLAALPRFWVHSLGRQRTCDERIISRPNTQPGLPSNNHLGKLPRSAPARVAPPRVAPAPSFRSRRWLAAGHGVSSDHGAALLPAALWRARSITALISASV